MRDDFTPIVNLRRKVFEAIAKMAWETPPEKYGERMEQIPFEIIPGEDAHYRESVF